MTRSDLVRLRWIELRSDAAEWASSRSALFRLPLLAYLAWGFLRHLKDPEYGTFLFSGVTLGIHELGHVVFSFAGHFITAAGGSLAQIAAPIAVMMMFARQRDYFAISVGGAWLSFSLFDLARYVGDARAQDLPLVGLTDDPEHDWHYLLSALGMLRLDTTFAFLLRSIAFLTGLAAIAFGAWICWRMLRPARDGATDGRAGVPRP